ncbi:Acetyl-coenzyme A carboxylase carboxyl transferase subunit alpha [Leclercia adecarboxylata]|uniref:Acetyl-coenzyme A carboxylase carboxyl transferase subunit alpha n=1 Tax=Leclercia adecarboxylata TaxID=83655 RepID=A0A4V6JHI2_9ENTR|nr:Acetyl-coenzyme A carboxylase carboxyl transferase subunit alpha [Leclercia adecarboxylata]
MAASLKAQLLADLADLDVLSKEDLLNRRYQRPDELRLRVSQAIL